MKTEQEIQDELKKATIEAEKSQNMWYWDGYISALQFVLDIHIHFDNVYFAKEKVKGTAET